MTNIVWIKHASQLATLAQQGKGPRIKETMNELSIIEDGSIWIEDGVIKAVGTTGNLRNSSKTVHMKPTLQMQQAILSHQDSSIHIHMLHTVAAANANLKCVLKVRRIWKL